MRVLALIIFALLFAMPVQAGFTGAASAPAADGKGGFTGPGATNNTTVQAAKGMRDDTHVTLTGNIVSRISGDKYLFRDATGEITIEIDDDDFRGQNVSPDNTVRIFGEVEKDFGEPAEIDVDRLDVLK